MVDGPRRARRSRRCRRCPRGRRRAPGRRPPRRTSRIDRSGRHGAGAARQRELDLEGRRSHGLAGVLGGEPLDVQRAGRPAGAALLDGVQQRVGAAAVDEGVRRPARPRRRVQVEQARARPAGAGPTRSPWRRAARRRRPWTPRRAPAVQQPPVGAGRLGGGDHRQDRGDADAAGDEQVAGRAAAAGSGCAGPRTWTVAPRRAARARSAEPPRPVGLAQDGDPPGRPVGRVAAQRVLPDQVAGPARRSMCAPGAQAGSAAPAGSRRSRTHARPRPPRRGESHDEFEAHRPGRRQLRRAVRGRRRRVRPGGRAATPTSRPGPSARSAPRRSGRCRAAGRCPAASRPRVAPRAGEHAGALDVHQAVRAGAALGSTSLASIRRAARPPVSMLMHSSW